MFVYQKSASIYIMSLKYSDSLSIGVKTLSFTNVDRRVVSDSILAFIYQVTLYHPFSAFPSLALKNVTVFISNMKALPLVVAQASHRRSEKAVVFPQLTPATSSLSFFSQLKSTLDILHLNEILPFQNPL